MGNCATVGFHQVQSELRQEDLTVSQKVSIDQYQSSTPGRLPHTKRKKLSALKYKGMTIFVYHCSKFIFIFNQVSLGGGETLTGKSTFKSNSFGFSVQFSNGDYVFWLLKPSRMIFAPKSRR